MLHWTEIIEPRKTGFCRFFLWIRGEDAKICDIIVINVYYAKIIIKGVSSKII